MSKESEEKISSIKEMIEKKRSWKRCSRERMAKINRAYVDAIGAEVLISGANRVEVEKKVIDALGESLIEFTKVEDKYPQAVILLICLVWRWEACYAAQGQTDLANEFKTSRLQLCAAANAPLWMGALYASEAVVDIASTKPTDF